MRFAKNLLGVNQNNNQSNETNSTEKLIMHNNNKIVLPLRLNYYERMYINIIYRK